MGYSMSGNFGSFGAEEAGKSSIDTVKNFATKVSSLMSVQSAVDKKIAAMPGGPAKLRLIQMRDENRGVFQKYVLPVYNKVKNVINDYSMAFAGDEEEAMGVVPLIAWAAIAAAGAAATAATGYVYSAHQREMKILNDPAFSPSQKADLLKSGSIGGALSDIKTIAYVMVGALIAWQAFKMWKNR